jgi:hypothetical protein
MDKLFLSMILMKRLTSKQDNLTLLTSKQACANKTCQSDTHQQDKNIRKYNGYFADASLFDITF